MEMIDVPELARRLGVAKSQIYRKAKNGEIPSIRIGRYYRFPWPEILIHLSNGIFRVMEGDWQEK